MQNNDRSFDKIKECISQRYKFIYFFVECTKICPYKHLYNEITNPVNTANKNPSVSFCMKKLNS